MAQVHVLIVNSKPDSKYKDVLLTHLSSQTEEDKAYFWDREKFIPGEEEEEQFQKKLVRTDIIILLLSADFFNSDWCKKLEEKAFWLEKSKDIRVVPVMLRSILLGANYDARATVPIRNYPILGKHWHDRDEAFQFLAKEIGEIIDHRISGTFPPALKPPSWLKTAERKLHRNIGLLVYIVFLIVISSILFSPKRNLPASIKLTVSQVEFQLIDMVQQGLWTHKSLARQGLLKNFDQVIIPGKSVKFLNKGTIIEIPGEQIRISPSQNQAEPNLYLFNTYLSEWNITDSAQIRLTKNKGNPLLISVKNGKSTGQFNFNDSLEFYTESCLLGMRDINYKDDLDAVLYSSLGRVSFESTQDHFSMWLDFQENVNQTNLHVSDLRFQKDSRNAKGTLLSTIISGEIDIDGFKSIIIDIPEANFLEIYSRLPLIIQSIQVSDSAMELQIIGEAVKNIELGTTIENKIDQLPTMLEWLYGKYKFGLAAGLLALISPLVIFAGYILKN